MTTPQPTLVHVRFLFDIGGHRAGDEAWLTDRPLTADYATPAVRTLVQSYRAAGYVEVIQ